MRVPNSPVFFGAAYYRSFTLAVLTATLTLTASAAGVANTKAANFYEDALTRYEKKDLDGAIIQLKNALQIDKSMLPVQVLLGKALLQNGDLGAAEVALTEALRLGVNRAEVVVLLGQAFVGQGKHKQVLEQSLFSLTGLPASVQLQMLLLQAGVHSDLGDSRSALKAIADARAIDARLPAVWLAEVPIRIRARQFKEANTAAEQALTLAPTSAEAFYQKGSIAHVAGNLTDTLAAYDRALKFDARHVEARVARAGLLMDQRRQPEAAKDLEELKRASPKEPRAAYLRALLAEQNQQPEQAKTALKEVTGLIDPVPIDFIRYRPQLLMLNGLAHFGLNEREKAKQYLDAFQRSQGNTPASKLLAQIYLGESNVDKAIDILETYLKANPADGQAMTLLGSALMSKGHNARAVSLMQQALTTRDNPAFRTVLGLGLIRSGQTGTGITQLETSYKQDPTQIQAGTALVALYLQGNQPTKAVSVAEVLVKQQPTNAVFHNLLGMSKGQTGNLTEARAAFEKAVALDAGLMAPKLNLARLEIASKAYDAATTRLGAILKIDEKNTEAMFEMGVLSERRGQPTETLRWLEKANALAGPKEVRWGLALSDFHLRNGRPGPALDAIKKVSGRAPDDLGMMMGYAKAQLANGDIAGAKSMLTNATRVADYNPTSQLQIALLQLSANNASGAAYSLEKALSTQPDYLPAMALMAEVELRQGDAAKAEARARDIVAKNPKRAIGYSLLGDVAQIKGQPTAALDAYRRAHATEPSSSTLMKLFRALASQDNGKPALQLAEQWMKTHPADLMVQKVLANSYARAGNFVMARTAYDTLLKANPDDAEALNNQANVLLRLKDPGAIKMAELAVAKNANNPNAIDTLGWALFQNGQNERALQLLRDARLRDPTNPEIRYHLAVMLAKAGRKAEAREELGFALKETRNFESASDAKRLHETLK